MEMPVTEYVCYPTGIGVDGQWYKTIPGWTSKTREEINGTTLGEGINPVIDNKDVSATYKDTKGENLGDLLTHVPEELEGAIPISDVSNYATITDAIVVLFQDNCKSTNHPCKNGVVRYAAYMMSGCTTTVTENGEIQIKNDKTNMYLKKYGNNFTVTRRPKVMGYTMRVKKDKQYSGNTVFVKVRESAAGEEDEEDDDEEDGEFGFHFLDFLNIRLKF
jgi:hypothetical protein